MNIRGTVKSLSVNYGGGTYLLTVEMTEGNAAEVEKLLGADLSIDMKQWRARRSNTANGLLWHCIGIIAAAQLGEQKRTPWEIYLSLLRRYGQYTLVSVKAEAVGAFQKTYRECEEVGRKYDANGCEWVDLLCYFGSSNYDSREFAILLDGCIDDMRQAGLETPTSEEMRRVLEKLNKQEVEE